MPKLGTRARIVKIPRGSWIHCDRCGDLIHWKDPAGHDHEMTVCNIYAADRWDRLERFHPRCYVEVGEPYGRAERTQTQRQVAKLTERSRAERLKTTRSVLPSTAKMLDALTLAYPDGLSTQELAEISGRSRSAVGNWVGKSRYIVRLPSSLGSRKAIWGLRNEPLKEAS